MEEVTREEMNLFTWIITCLTEVGVDADVAGRIAAIPHLDLHRAVEMKENGCPQLLILEILS